MRQRDLYERGAKGVRNSPLRRRLCSVPPSSAAAAAGCPSRASCAAAHSSRTRFVVSRISHKVFCSNRITYSIAGCFRFVSLSLSALHSGERYLQRPDALSVSHTHWLTSLAPPPALPPPLSPRTGEGCLQQPCTSLICFAFLPRPSLYT
jgi:hypothetical protein